MGINQAQLSCDRCKALVAIFNSEVPFSALLARFETDLYTQAKIARIEETSYLIRNRSSCEHGIVRLTDSV